jgi:hypothetical protein
MEGLELEVGREKTGREGLKKVLVGMREQGRGM